MSEEDFGVGPATSGDSWWLRHTSENVADYNVDVVHQFVVYHVMI